MRRPFTMTLVLSAAVSPVFGDEPKSKKDANTPARGEVRIFEQDMAGAYFIDRPLMEKYETLRRRVAGLRADIDGGRINSAKAHAEVAALKAELDELLKTIDAVKRYVPGATVHKRSETFHVPIRPDDLLLVDAENVEVRGWDGPDVQCVLEKTVLDDGKGKVDDDLAGIALVSRKGSGRDIFGFYVDVQEKPQFRANEDMQRELRRFVFTGFIGHQFPYITVKGLVYEEGNRQITVQVSQPGEGFMASEWRRHAKLTLLVPKCQRVGIRGALGRLKVRDLDASLAVLGQGNRDYTAVYEVANLRGSLDAENIPIQRIDGVKGNVTVTATAYTENKSSGRGPDGATASVSDPKESIYRNIEGNLRARFCRANLTIGDVGGRVNVRNDFGDTLWQTDRELSQKAGHWVVSESGTIALRLGARAPGKLEVEMFTECGKLRRGGDVEKALNAWFEETMFQTGDGDDVRRAWTRWTRHAGSRTDQPRHGGADPFARFRLPADTLHDRPRSPGIAVISRAGTISIAAPEPGPTPGK